LGKVVLTYEQPGDIHSGKNKVVRAGAGGGGTTNYNDLENKPSINDVTLAGNKTSADLGLLDVDQGTENEGKVMQVNASGMVVPATLPTPTPSADEVSYDSTPSILSGDNVEEALDSVDNRFSQIGRLQYHLPEWTKKIKYIKVDTINNYGSGAYFGEKADFVDVYPPDKTVYSEYFLNDVQYTLGYNTYKAGPFYSSYPSPVQLCWTFNDFIDIEKTPYLLLYSNSGSGAEWSNHKPTRLRFKFSEDNQIWNEFTVDITQMPIHSVGFSGAPSNYTTYFYVYIDVREFVGTDSTLIVNNTCKEISYQDYLALSDAEKMNGTAYYINDLDIDNGEHRLDTTEKMVDIWYDGRPIYEKLFILDESVDIGARGGGTLITDPTSYNFDNIVKCTCISGNSSAICYPEAYIATDPGVQPLVAIQEYPFLVKYFILQYTKTNDEPLPEGVGRSDGGLADPIHVYSTEERFIGKWIDGKNIYEKTFDITSYVTQGGGNYEMNFTCDNLIDAHGFVKGQGIQNTVMPIPYCSGDRSGVFAIYYETTGKLHFHIVSMGTLNEGYITVQYTKQTT